LGKFARQIRHTRVLDIRSKIAKGWKLKELEDFCITHLKVSKSTVNSYIDEAAAPFRKKYAQEHPEEIKE